MPEQQRGLIAGVSRSLIDGTWDWPIHGLRHPPHGDASGWYIWTGELSPADDFFAPWHTSHLLRRCADLTPLLAAPPGSRFVIAPGYLDTWNDPTLLEV